MKISAEERAMREALRPQTRARATKLMNEILKKQQEAAARGDHEKYRYYQEQISSIASASADADYMAIERAETAWSKQQQEQQSAADAALAAKAPISNVREILTRAHQKKAQEQREMQRRLTAHLKR
jgi:pantothenate synthetase